MASLNDHCNGNPHMKAFCSFKISVLKMLAEIGQNEVPLVYHRMNLISLQINSQDKGYDRNTWH